jgi:glutamate decarboxylase
MLPAYTMPPNAQEVKVLRALVKHTLSRAQIDRLANDIEHACDTLEKKGTGAHTSERKKIKRSPNI